MGESLKDLFGIKRGDVVTITGSGGKTSLMFALADLLKKEGRVLITTSTKIGLPQKGQADYICSSLSQYKKIRKEKFSLVLGEYLKEKDKLSSIGEGELEKIRGDFDFILIEGDGSRNLPLKYRKDYEPVIFPQTTKTIAVFPIKVLGKSPSRDLIYNYEAYKREIGKGIIDEEAFLKLIKSTPGPFKDFPGEKFVYINQADTDLERNKAEKLIDFLRENTRDIEYAYGSLPDRKN